MLLANWLKELTNQVIWAISNLTICILLLVLLFVGIVWFIKKPDKFMRFLQRFFR